MGSTTVELAGAVVMRELQRIEEQWPSEIKERLTTLTADDAPPYSARRAGDHDKFVVHDTTPISQVLNISGQGVDLAIEPVADSPSWRMNATYACATLPAGSEQGVSCSSRMSGS
jgi:hypothetical protein